jgi:polyhydroxyalkanoate synthase
VAARVIPPLESLLDELPPAARGEEPVTTPRRAVWRRGPLTLWRYGLEPPGRAGRPLLLLPSIINRPYVFDLRPGQSLVEFLVAESGRDVLLLDWGRPGRLDARLGLEDYALGLLRPALREALRLSGHDRAHLLGYCLGGTFALIAATRLPEVASVLALTTPVALSEPGALGALVDARLLDLTRLAAAFPVVPGPLLWSAFQALDPAGIGRKWRGFQQRAPEDAEFRARFLAQEGWLADPVDVSARALVDVVQRLYREDALWRGSLVLEGRAVRLAEGRCPVLNLIAQGDGIVPPAASRPLAERWGGPVTTRELPGGHVGITVGSKARAGMWKTAAEWLAARDLEETGA